MTDADHSAHVSNSNESSSDGDDSISLLHDLDTRQWRTESEDTQKHGLPPKTGSDEVETNQLKPALYEAAAGGYEASVELLKAAACVRGQSCDGVTVTPQHDTPHNGPHQGVKQDTSATHSEDNNELLHKSSVTHKMPLDPPGTKRLAGAMSSQQQGVCLKSLASKAKCSKPSDGKRNPSSSKISGSKKGPIVHHLNHSVTITEMLERVDRRQRELWSVPLSGPEVAVQYHGALTEIQSVLNDLLSKHLSERDELVRKYQNRRGARRLQQGVVKSQLMSITFRQRNLLVIIEKQIHLVKAFMSMKAESSSQHPANRSNLAVTQRQSHLSSQASSFSGGTDRPVGFSNTSLRDIRLKESQKKAGLLRSPPPDNIKGKECKSGPRPAPSATPQQTHMKALNREVGRTISQVRNTEQYINVQINGNKALTESGAKGDSRRLSQLIKEGKIPRESVVTVLLRGRQHSAHVQGNGSIRDNEGKLHVAPERWLESILGNNIPVSSTYAWDKVMFRDKPLSCYRLCERGTEEDAPQTRPQPQRSGGSSDEKLPPVTRIRRIRLVSDEEMMPNAVAERCWDELLRSGDWLLHF